jgi:hypothetical protein
VDPVPDPLFLRKSGSAGNRNRTSGSVARNSDYKTIEAVAMGTINSKMYFIHRGHQTLYTYLSTYGQFTWIKFVLITDYLSRNFVRWSLLNALIELVFKHFQCWKEIYLSHTSTFCTLTFLCLSFVGRLSPYCIYMLCYYHPEHVFKSSGPIMDGIFIVHLILQSSHFLIRISC